MMKRDRTVTFRLTADDYRILYLMGDGKPSTKGREIVEDYIARQKEDLSIPDAPVQEIPKEEKDTDS
jgi:hypothetical protein